VFPLSASCDHVGTLTATVEQAARLLGVLARMPVALRPVHGLRMAVLQRQLDDPDLTSGVRARVHEAIAAFEAAGLEVLAVDVPELELVDDALSAVVLREAWDIHRTLYESEADKYGEGTRALLELGSRIGDDEYRGGVELKQQVAAAFARVFENADVLFGPTVAYPAPPVDPPFGTPEGELEGRYTSPYNLAGVPAISLPCGIAEGTLPAGLQLAAALGEDALLLSVARAYEEIAL
jgi:aspartyl-tRNA(Asn)/glutamyl-tRNA(Gln) amidotransferase subunit A